MSSRSGGLLELVARGKKDVFFTANPTVSFFHSVYVRSAPFTKEVYVTKPRNTPEWGRWVDFEIDHRGDIAKHFYMRIELPTWIPASVTQANLTGLVTDLSGVTFGYCNNIGFQMLEKIQIFQDQVLIHETYGEFLDWRLRQSYSPATTFVLAADVGARDESALSVGRSASRTMLRVPIPIFGWQHVGDPGLPTVALRNQRFRCRVFLRRLDELIVASDGRLAPKPWNLPLRVQATKGGPVDTTTYTTLPSTAMKSITMSLESTQLYVGADVSMYLRAQTLRFPFQHVQFQQYTLEDNQMTAAATASVANFYYSMPIDFIGSVGRMLLGIRSDAATAAGQRTMLRPPAPAERFLRTLRLSIANIDRIKLWPTQVFREVSAYWKHSRMALESADSDIPQEVYTITFGGFDSGDPSGTLNFTRASLPTLFATLQSTPYDTRNISRAATALLYAESWNIFEISGGVGKMMFDDS